MLTENGRIKRFSDYYDFVRFFLGYQLVQAPAATRLLLTGSSNWARHRISHRSLRTRGIRRILAVLSANKKLGNDKLQDCP